MRWKVLVLVFLFAVLEVIEYHHDSVGTIVGLAVVVPLVVGLSVWQALKFHRESPERKAELLAAAKARHAARQR